MKKLKLKTTKLLLNKSRGKKMKAVRIIKHIFIFCILVGVSVLAGYLALLI